ncbi:MAG: CvpA family protein, partial [Chloroflexota bacterium]
MELLAQLSWVDVAILALLAFGIFLGFTQGVIRYLLNLGAVFVAFIVSAQLKGPIADVLSVWQAFPAEGRELFFFLLFFFGLAIGGWFLIRAFFSRARLPVGVVLDGVA